MKRLLPPLIVLIALIVIYSVYRDNPEAQKKEAGPTVKIVYVEWSSSTASANVCKAVIEEELGYKCELTPVSAAAMFQSLSSGDQDAMTCCWLPTTHKNYYNKVKDKVIRLGPNLKGTRIGLVVPEYVDMSSIADLKLHTDKLNAEIVGIDPGAGVMQRTEEAMKAYGLDNYKLVEGSGATMTAALKGAIEQERWVVVTGWTPHWKWARWDLKYLHDPEKIYGEPGKIYTLTRLGLKEDMPEVYSFFVNFKWTPDQMQQVMAMNREEGAKPAETARKWVENHPDVVDDWLK